MEAIVRTSKSHSYFHCSHIIFISLIHWHGGMVYNRGHFVYPNFPAIASHIPKIYWATQRNFTPHKGKKTFKVQSHQTNASKPSHRLTPIIPLCGNPTKRHSAGKEHLVHKEPILHHYICEFLSATIFKPPTPGDRWTPHWKQSTTCSHRYDRFFLCAMKQCFRNCNCRFVPRHKKKDFGLLFFC